MYLSRIIFTNICTLITLDPVQAERNVDAMMRARERMQRELDEQAVLHEAKKQEVPHN